MGKESACNSGDTGDNRVNTWVVKIPWKRKWQPTPVFLLEKSHGQRSLTDRQRGPDRLQSVGHKESGTTEHTHDKRVIVSFFFSYILYFGGNTVFSVNNKVDNLVRTCHLHQENKQNSFQSEATFRKGQLRRQIQHLLHSLVLTLN